MSWRSEAKSSWPCFMEAWPRTRKLLIFLTLIRERSVFWWGNIVFFGAGKKWSANALKFIFWVRFLYTEKLSTAVMENDISLAFEVMKCAGKYGVPYLYIQCRQWIVQHFVEKFEDKEIVKTDALLYLQTVNISWRISNSIDVFSWCFQALRAEYEDHKILEAIWSEIDVCAESVLQTPDEVLRDVSLEVLTMFLARDSLTVLKEKHLYDFMTR